MSSPQHILFVTGQPGWTEDILRQLEAQGVPFDSQQVQTEADFLDRVREDPAVVLADSTVPEFDPLRALGLLREEGKATPFIVLAETPDDALAIECLKQGASGVLLKSQLAFLKGLLAPEVQPAEPPSAPTDGALKKYEFLVNTSRDVMSLVNSEYRYEAVNDAYCRAQNRSREAIVGKTGAELWGEDVFETIIKPKFDQCFAGNEVHYEASFEFAGLGRRSFDVAYFPYHNEDGAVTHCVVVSRDLTERVLAEERIREQAALLDETQDAILVQDMDGRIRYWNKTAERLYGWAANEILGHEAAILFSEKGPLQSEDDQTAFVEDGQWRGEVRQITKTGEEITVESRWTLMRDGEGHAKSILVVNTDISEKKKMEAHFLRAQRMESLGTLAGGIAHDLNNVLTPILMSIDMLKWSYPDQETQDLLDALQATAQRGADIVKQVLMFARGVQGERTTLQPNRLIRDIEKMVHETFPKALRIKTDVSTDLWTVSGDATQLHQVLLNLCVNARDAMPGGGTLTVAAKNLWLDENNIRQRPDARAGAYVQLSVSDTGTGMPAEIIDRIFEPFFTTKDTGKGTGLGLSTVQAIVKSHQGFIEVESELGKGTSFKIYLPSTASLEARPVAEPKPQMPAGHGELILVVDDEASILDISKQTLETFGYKVLVATDGAEAVAVFAQNRDVDVALVDMMMPLMDGPATIRALRRIDPEIKIVAISGLMAGDKAVELGDTEVEAYLPKPFTAEKLLTMLYETLRRDSQKK